jgi:ankyrin repeat protein
LKKETFKKSRIVLSFLCEYGETDILRKVLESQHFDMVFPLAIECFEFASSEAIVDMLAEFGACTLISDHSKDNVMVPPSLCNVEMPTCTTIRHLAQSLKKYPDLTDCFRTQTGFRSLLEYATAKGFEQVARLCVFDTSIANRRDAFFSAVKGRINPTGRISIIRCLLEAGVQPENTLHDNIAILLFDIITQPYNEDVVRLLISSVSSDLETTYLECLTVLLWAIQQGRKAYVKIFLSAGSDPMARTRDGATALILAVKLGDLSSFRSILECAKCELNARDKNGRTALSWCATVADECAITMASDLLKSPRVDPNSKEKSGQTVLMRAVQSGNPKLVKTLLSSTVSSTVIDPDLGSCGRSTPLRLAFKLYREDRHQVFWEISRLLLLTFNVNPDCDDKLPTPSELASEYGFIELLNLLEVFKDVVH